MTKRKESKEASPPTRRPINYAALRDQIPLQRVVEHVQHQSIASVQHRGHCPLHEPTATTGRTFSANVKRHVFRCFDPQCQAQGNILDFWQAYRHIKDIYDATIDLAKTFDLSIPFLEQPKPQLQKRQQKKSSGHHPPTP